MRWEPFSNDREFHLSITDAERQGLARIAQRRRWVWYVFIAFVPVVALAALVGGPDALNTVGFAVLALWAVIVALSGFARCPRCANIFSMGNGIANPWRRTCGNCGLALE